MRLISEDSGFNVSNRFIIIFMLNFYAGSDKEDGLMSALFFVAPARQSEAFSRREASPLGHEQAPVGCKNTKHEVRGIRGAKIGHFPVIIGKKVCKMETKIIP